MSPFQKQLQARQSKTPSRVGHKQKKFLALMESETRVDDSKNVQLLNYKKIEVRLIIDYTDNCSGEPT